MGLYTEGGLMEAVLTNSTDIKCQFCGHDIDNHTYSGCLVVKCKCKNTPSSICLNKEGE